MAVNNDLIFVMRASLPKPQHDICVFANRVLTNDVATDDCEFARLIVQKDWVGVKRCLDSIRDEKDIAKVLGKSDRRAVSWYKEIKDAHAQVPSCMDWKGAFQMGAWLLGVGVALLLGYWFISVVGMFEAKPGQMSELELLKQENLALKNQTEDLLSQTAALASRVAQLEKVNSSRLEERVFVLEHLGNEIREEVKNEVNAEILALNQSSKQAVESVFNNSLLQVAAFNKSVENMQTSANILRQEVNEFRSEARELNQTLHETREDFKPLREDSLLLYKQSIATRESLRELDERATICLESVDVRLGTVNTSIELATSRSSAALWVSMSSLAVGFAGFVVIVVVYTWYWNFMYKLVMRVLEPRVLALETNLTGRVFLLEESLKPAVDPVPSGPGMRRNRGRGT